MSLSDVAVPINGVAEQLIYFLASTGYRLANLLDPKKSALGITRIYKPKFSSWGKEVLCQVVDVDPITVFGNFDNG